MRREPIWTKDFILIVVSLFLIACANYFFAASIAVYAEAIGIGPVEAGLIASAFYFSSVAMRTVNGVMVQRYGALRMMYISALLCAAICFAFRFVEIAVMLFILRILHGIGHSIFSTASGTAASYIVPQSRMSEGMGYYTFGNVLALAVGPMVALSISTESTLSDFQTLFYLTSAICLFSFVLLFLISPAADGKVLPSQTWSPTPDGRKRKTYFGFEEGVLMPVIVCFLMTFAYSSLFVYLAKYGLEKGFDGMGIAFVCYAFGLFGSRLFSGRLGDKYGPNCVMFPAYLFGIASLGIAAFCTAKWQLEFAMLLMGFCIGIYNPQLNVFCIKRCSHEHRGTAMAAFYGSTDLGLAVGSAVNGALIAKCGFFFTYLSGASVCFLAMVIYFFSLSGIVRKNRDNLS